MNNEIVIGIDQSYSCTGIATLVNGTLEDVKDVNKGYKDELGIDYRVRLKDSLKRHIEDCNRKYTVHNKFMPGDIDPPEGIIMMERTRLFSHGKINFDVMEKKCYLDALIIDVAQQYGYKCYSVDTRAWKTQIVGSIEAIENNEGIPPEKYPTIFHLREEGYQAYIQVPVLNSRERKGVFEEDGTRYKWSNDRADAICIAQYYYVDPAKRKLEDMLK